MNENASYYVFFQAVDGVFEAFPVDEWYNFTTVNRYKALTSEEAEEKFAERNKIFNFFPVMSNKRNDENEGSNNKKVKNSMKITDLDEWGCSDDSRSEDEVDDVDVKPKIKKEKKEVKKKKKGAADSSESEAHEESDEGDFDDKELEYISDSSDESESESDNEKTAPKGVEDEEGIRKVILSDDEDEEEDEKNKNGDETDKNDDKNSLKDDSVKIKSEKDSSKYSFEKNLTISNYLYFNLDDSPPPSSSDSDDSDVDDSKSALFMQRPPQKLALNKSKNGSEQSTSRSTTPTLNELQGSPGTSKTDTGKLKRKNSASDLANAAKKSKLSQDLNTDGISEEAVRKYLIRKPMTTKDLLQKFRKQVSTKDELLHSIAEILKRLNPQKEMIKGKLYLSLKE